MFWHITDIFINIGIIVFIVMAFLVTIAKIGMIVIEAKELREENKKHE